MNHAPLHEYSLSAHGGLMEYSLSAHGGLREYSLSPHLRKGREGNRKGREGKNPSKTKSKSSLSYPPDAAVLDLVASR